MLGLFISYVISTKCSPYGRQSRALFLDANRFVAFFL